MSKYVELKALEGGTSDNLPGVPGRRDQILSYHDDPQANAFTEDTANKKVMQRRLRFHRSIRWATVRRSY